MSATSAWLSAESCGWVSIPAPCVTSLGVRSGVELQAPDVAAVGVERIADGLIGGVDERGAIGADRGVFNFERAFGEELRRAIGVRGIERIQMNPPVGFAGEEDVSVRGPEEPRLAGGHARQHGAGDVWARR